MEPALTAFNWQKELLAKLGVRTEDVTTIFET